MDTKPSGFNLILAARAAATSTDLDALIAGMRDNPAVESVHAAAILGTIATRTDLGSEYAQLLDRIIEASGYSGPLDGISASHQDSKVAWLVSQRGHHEWSAKDINDVVQGYVSGTLSDEHMAALLASILVKNLSFDETVALTTATANSGTRLDWKSTGKKAVDKHSTGGVGDSPSFVIAPLVAATMYDHALVPMMSGNRLEHTGGTLSKLRAIPGLRTAFSTTDIYDVLNRVGCAIFEQTADIAPADRKMYALRSRIACVPEAGVITASIDGKKLAAGVEFLVQDTKTGSGAFFPELGDARDFAQRLCNVAAKAGQDAVSFITDMNQPLAPYAGNTLEVIHAVEALLGKHQNSRFMDVAYRLAQEMCIKVDPLFPAAKLYHRIQTGEVYERFIQMVEAQGGDTQYIKEIERTTREKGTLQTASPEEIAARVAGRGEERCTYVVRAPYTGYLSAIALRKMGFAINAMQGPDERTLDDQVGIVMKAELGSYQREGDPLAVVVYNRKGMGSAPENFDEFFTIAPEIPEFKPAIKEMVLPNAV
ncbi:MAG TPA: thymidine phosphorylase [Candidatus Nanoarchaeia archaeon]|nr:thymidine phosphorylase [Candidatus Nanoarchaeia archaeon]